MDAAEHLHHKGNAVLQSQVRDLSRLHSATLIGGTCTENVQPLGGTCIVRKTSDPVLALFIRLGMFEPCFGRQAFHNIIVTVHNLELTRYELIN